MDYWTNLLISHYFEIFVGVVILQAKEVFECFSKRSRTQSDVLTILRGSALDAVEKMRLRRDGAEHKQSMAAGETLPS